jgi:hypothetical protein
VPFHSTSLRPRSLDKTFLWATVWLFAALGLAYAIYPGVYVYNHFNHGVSHSSGNFETNIAFALSPATKIFLLAAAVGLLGFVQLLGKPEGSTILFRLFLCLSGVVLCGSLFIAFTTRFHTADAGLRANQIIAYTGPASIFFLKVGLGVAVLNILLSSLRKRSV